MANEYSENELVQGTAESSFGMDEIEKNFKDVDFFFEIMESLREALDYTQGKTRDTTMIHIVEE